jgi:hypothetical protein
MKLIIPLQSVLKLETKTKSKRHASTHGRPFNLFTTTKFHLPGGAQMEGVPANEFYGYSKAQGD